VTYGRSGSTLMMGILNSIPGYKIVGENNDALSPLMDFRWRMKKAKQSNDHMQRSYITYGPKNPWWNVHSDRQLDAAIRDLMTRLIANHEMVHTIGFKEIRYNSHDDLEDYLTSINEVFHPKFIFLTRNLDDVSTSKWHAKNPIRVKEKLSKFETDVEEYITKHKEQNWHWIRYEDIKEKNYIRVKQMYDFLGEEFDVDVFNRVVSEKHGY